MFENIGEKIRTLAKVLCFSGLVISGIAMIGIWITGGGMEDVGGFTIFVWGLSVGVLGTLATWTIGLLSYGLGQLIEDTQAIRLYSEDTQYCTDSLRRMGEDLRRGRAQRARVPAEENL